MLLQGWCCSCCLLLVWMCCLQEELWQLGGGGVPQVGLMDVPQAPDPDSPCDLWLPVVAPTVKPFIRVITTNHYPFFN